LKENGLEFAEYFVIFEVCNPKKTKDILEINVQAGYVLPCKMVVRSKKDKIILNGTS
jgi:uncharacterized protein (DUF302 family)